MWGVEESEVAFAGEVGAVCSERRGHAVVDVVAGVGVCFGFEGRWVGHLHMGFCCGAHEGEGEEVLEGLHIGWRSGVEGAVG